MFKQRSLTIVFITSYLIWASCSVVNAGVILSIDPLNATSKVSVGTNFSVPFYLIQNGSESRLSSDGLFSFDFRGYYDSSKLEFVSATINNAFDLLPGSNSSTAGQFDMFGAALSGVVAPANNILLGTITMKALVKSTSFITLADTVGDGFILNDTQNSPQTVLDPLIFGSQLSNTYSFEIQAVPEPSSFMLLALIGIGLFPSRPVGQLKTLRLLTSSVCRKNQSYLSVAPRSQAPAWERTLWKLSFPDDDHHSMFVSVGMQKVP